MAAVIKAAEAPVKIEAPTQTRSRVEFKPVVASKLGGGERIKWLWEGYLARGFSTMLVGLWKGGKTTLIAHLLKTLEHGGNLAGEVNPAKVLVVTEEAGWLWACRRDDLGLGDHVSFAIRPFKVKPPFVDWELFVSRVAESVQRGDFELVIIDPWQSVNPCPDENDAMGTMRAITPIHQITDAGAAVLLVQHPKKGGANEAQGSRGSGALPAFVDVIVELGRFNANICGDRRRKLAAFSRFDETPDKVVIELMDNGYRLVGTTGDASRVDRQKLIGRILADSANPLTVDEIRERWIEGTIPKPGKRTTQADLDDGCDHFQWQWQTWRPVPLFDSRT